MRRSVRRRKTIQITVDGGGLQVAAPLGTPTGVLRAIVHQRAAWILNHASATALEAAPTRFVSGECQGRRAFRAWQRYNATGDRTELVELRFLPADSAASSIAAEEYSLD